ncbi:MAG: hypothetical protein ACK4SN_12975, partial [Bellilinea sp.]
MGGLRLSFGLIYHKERPSQPWLAPFVAIGASFFCATCSVEAAQKIIHFLQYAQPCLNQSKNMDNPSVAGQPAQPLAELSNPPE